MLTETTPYRLDLGDGLVLRSVRDQPDADRLAAFNGLIHGAGVASMTRALLLRHPHTRPEHWLYVEDTKADRIVSSLCLIPWTWLYEGIGLKAGEVGIVGTLEEYRHRGLVRAQMSRHDQLLHLEECDISHIQGIPYFYRQFGYEYALPLEVDWRIEPFLVPNASEDRVAAYAFRQATLDDITTLVRLYDRAAEGQSISAVRSYALWQYLLGPSLDTEMAAETWLLTDRAGATAGYFRVSAHGFGEGLIVSEVSALDNEAASVVLCQLKRLALGRAKPYIRLNLPRSTTLVQAARHLGARDAGGYALQLRVVDVNQLLGKLSPILERRISASPFAGLTQTVSLNLYREAFALCFEKGKLVSVKSLGFSQEGDIRIPPLLVPSLLFGHRSGEQLASAHHDVSIRKDCRHLASVLFPTVEAFIYTIY